jgi:hypothetical protein
MALTVTNTVNPIKVTGDTAVDTEILGKSAAIKFIKWYNPTTTGHLCHITDGEGVTISKMYCDTAHVTQIDPVFTWVNGVKCDDLDSGELYIYIR